MRILMLLSNPYRPDPRVEKEARALVENGNDVTILAWDREWLYPRTTDESGIIIERIRTRRFMGKSGLMKNYPRFVLGCMVRARKMQFDVVHSHDLDTLLIGVLVSRLRNVPLVYDAHEHYAKMIEADVPEWTTKCADRLERNLIRFSDRTIAANEKIAEYLSDWTEASPVVVMNCIDLDPSEFDRSRREGDIVLFYGGSLEPLRFIEDILVQMKDVKDVRLRIAGTGSLVDLVKDAAKNDPRIEYLGHLDKVALGNEMSQADGVLALLDPCNENNRIGTPNRMYEAMAHGTPVIASEGTLSGDIVRSENSGIVIEWMNGSLQNVVNDLKDRKKVESWGENGRQAVRSKYNWQKMKRRLTDLYETLR